MPGDDHSPTTTGRIQGEAKYIAPLLGDIAAQAAEADRTRSVASDGSSQQSHHQNFLSSAAYEWEARQARAHRLYAQIPGYSQCHASR